MGYGEIFETTNQLGERIRVRDELPDKTVEMSEFESRAKKVHTHLASLAIAMNTYSTWFTPAPPAPSLKPFNPFKTDQLPLQTMN
jgi:hypothetical protein